MCNANKYCTCVYCARTCNAHSVIEREGGGIFLMYYTAHHAILTVEDLRI